MNVTAVGGTEASFLTIWPSDVSPRPLASNLNWVPNSPPTPNKVDVKLSATGSINFFNPNGTVSVIADVVGYYADHNHDDRYYTEAESDARFAPRLWAVVNSDGTLARGAGVVGVEKLAGAAGRYAITFDRNVTECAYVAVPGQPTGGSVFARQATTAPRDGEPNAAFVRIEDNAGASADSSFHLIVSC
jgi:hypothetical protein